MLNLFKDALTDSFAHRALYAIPYGGADFAECTTTAQRIGDSGDPDTWHREWTATANRLFDLAENAATRGHVVSAREAYLRASTYYRVSYFPLYGAPVDPRLLAAFQREAESFQKAATRLDPPGELVEIPYEGTTLPGCFLRADDSEEPRPTLIATDGYDSTLHEMYFYLGLPALRRGYNVLLFDGPGQGRALIEQGLPSRPDWENVVRPVVDYLLTRPDVDTARIALMGWSLGGYLAPRAASGESRLAACIADPGQFDLGAAARGMLAAFHASAEELARFPHISPVVLEPLWQRMLANPNLYWRLKQRALWVHGVETFSSYLNLLPAYTIADRATLIQCPTLVCQAENDPIAQQAEQLYEALTCPKAFLRFTAAEGAGNHCEMEARALFNQRAFDWLDETLAINSTDTNRKS